MKKLSALMAAVALFAGAGVVFAGDFSGSGEIVELSCYNSRSASGAGHAGCAKKCLSDGKGMGLLQEDGTVVKLQKGDDEAPYNALIELAGMQAKVTGSESDGMVTVLTAEAG